MPMGAWFWSRIAGVSGMTAVCCGSEPDIDLLYVVFVGLCRIMAEYGYAGDRPAAAATRRHRFVERNLSRQSRFGAQVIRYDLIGG
jgi:hypothetical protein